MNGRSERIPHLGRSNPPEGPMKHPSKKVVQKKMETQIKRRDDNTTKQRHMQIGDRVVKIIFTSDKKKRKEQKKRKEINMLISQKRKKKKEFEKKKKMVRKMNNMIRTEREKGNVYFLPKKFRPKKKTKRKKLILLEKEVKQSVYNDLLRETQNGGSRGQLKITLRHMERLSKCSKEGYIKFIARKVRCRAMGHTDSANYRWGEMKKEERRRRDSWDGQHLEGASTSAMVDETKIGEEVARVRRFLLLWGGKFPRGGVKRSGIDESIRKDAEIETPQCADSVNPSEAEHDEGDLVNREKIKERILKNEKIMNYIKTTKVQKKTYLNEYVDQVITEELNNMVKSFLEKISKSQEKLFLLRKKKKRYYLGLRESYRHICIDNPKLVLLAPNIEPMTNGVFDDQVNKIICKCREKGIPLVYALSKNLLGKCIKKSRQSVICIVDNDSYIRECEEIVRLANSLRRHAPVSTHDMTISSTLSAP
ncbi:SECIS-binding protein 2, putative [Plasmodium knowlesi strain H]|uniref:SECIS-binding protein 2, putative n=3 Tax=Plasmodium knowlesi TaxID=5850 RepID=A0A5K1VB49_PLAKH|nr:SECIS-binding protein 2, putative [Plasmodium knowlesi strain H]OTN65730.1 putative Ribosomal protein [Plasmodium knowlesi]CAA9987971.1 SECIS-binding protein 2, putative [Plasmodium knowlesi strain H]SBO22129.1 SECIS-binding protein 2, putative [Plasmodium knowlesi strain H]SBO29172.1 SECIS-binding protein 2, putative [Plasmodium knowlesi strain H]VVS77445.1 SECIS-binding protein 2, putative [Plasmodium knowlesi strain H]|eukprot:XP_002258950.1 ribosomal protein, putative [Plasmodium knowlesi strain H]